MSRKDKPAEGTGTCVHYYVYRAICRNCGGDALHMLEGRIEQLDQCARAALGYVITGDRNQAEKVLREALSSPPSSEGKDT